MKTRLIAVGIATFALMIGGIAAVIPAEANSQNDIVGSWEVQAIGAKYEPHLFTFEADGNMFSTNPTNVQEDPASAHGGTNDSVGMGTWRKDGKFIFGTFYELNAFADNHQPTDTLEVRFRVKVDGDKFAGDWFIAAFDARGTFTADRLVFRRWTPA